MASTTKQFLGNVIKQEDLASMFASAESVTAVRVGERLKAALLSSDDYNERQATLYGFPITWVAGNTITVSFRKPAKKYNTANLEPACLEKARNYQATLRLNTGEQFSLSETIESALNSVLGVKE